MAALELGQGRVGYKTADGFGHVQEEGTVQEGGLSPTRAQVHGAQVQVLPGRRRAPAVGAEQVREKDASVPT